MCLKIRYDEKSEKFYKIFWELNRPQDAGRFLRPYPVSSPVRGPPARPSRTKTKTKMVAGCQCSLQLVLVLVGVQLQEAPHRSRPGKQQWLLHPCIDGAPRPSINIASTTLPDTHRQYIFVFIFILSSHLPSFSLSVSSGFSSR
jgi:hypothetical protein